MDHRSHAGLADDRSDSPVAMRSASGSGGPDFEVLVILAPPRSFGTIVSAMLGQHPQLYGLPETHFFVCDSIDEWSTLYRGTDRMSGGLRAVAQVIFGEQSDLTVRLAKRWLQARSHYATAAILRLMRQRVAPNVFVERTPQVAATPDAMRRIRREFPPARFLHLLRHPHDQVASRLKRRMALSGDGRPKSLTEAAQQLGG